jgi:SAM-dependent methyltransferase
MAISNRQEADAEWDDAAGGYRVKRAGLFDYDAELGRYNELLRAATGVGPGDRVLDIGCGAGQSTRDAARAALPGDALGVDLSARMLELARGRSAAEGVHNIRFEQADAQRHPFPTSHFDVAISRFGTMFFAGPVEAFTNVGRALRPAARLVMLVWQDSDRQEWSAAISESLAPGRALPAATAGDPFSLADPSTVDGILDAAGFAAVSRADLREPIYYGPDVATAYDAVLGLRMATDLLAGLADDDRPRALERLRAALARHESDRGVWFDSRAWLITAHRR